VHFDSLNAPTQNRLVPMPQLFVVWHEFSFWIDFLCLIVPNVLASPNPTSRRAHVLLDKVWQCSLLNGKLTACMVFVNVNVLFNSTICKMAASELVSWSKSGFTFTSVTVQVEVGKMASNSGLSKYSAFVIRVIFL